MQKDTKDKNIYPSPESIASVLALVGGKWKILILCILSSDIARFSELKRRIPQITQKMLTLQLRELESDGLVHRKVYAEVPPKVEYSLTKLGRSFLPVLQEMQVWGMKFIYRKGRKDKI